MSNVYLQDSTLTSIGGAIREKLNVDTKYLPSEMPEAIRSIEGGGSGEEDLSAVILPGGGMSRTSSPGTVTSLGGYQIYPNELISLLNRGWDLHLCYFCTLPYSTVAGEYGTDYMYNLYCNKSDFVIPSDGGMNNRCIIPEECVKVFNGLEFDSRFNRHFILIDVSLSDLLLSRPSEQSYSYTTALTFTLYVVGKSAANPIADGTGLWPSQVHFFPVIAKQNHVVQPHLVYYGNQETLFDQKHYPDTLQQIYKEHPNYSTGYFELFMGTTVLTGSRYAFSEPPYFTLSYRSGTNNIPYSVISTLNRVNTSLTNGGQMYLNGVSPVVPAFGGTSILPIPSSSLSGYYDMVPLMFSLEKKEE